VDEQEASVRPIQARESDAEAQCVDGIVDPRL